MSRAKIRGSSKRGRSRRGAVTVEYVILLSTVTIVMSAALVGWGPPLLRSYARTRAMLIAPVP